VMRSTTWVLFSLVVFSSCSAGIYEMACSSSAQHGNYVVTRQLSTLSQQAREDTRRHRVRRCGSCVTGSTELPHTSVKYVWGNSHSITRHCDKARPQSTATIYGTNPGITRDGAGLAGMELAKGAWISSWLCTSSADGLTSTTWRLSMYPTPGDVRMN